MLLAQVAVSRVPEVTAVEDPATLRHRAPRGCGGQCRRAFATCGA